ncbi:uncharacterized protein LOC125049932 [Pieris napi]|uniref:uncharacterized protein LOC125049932 n=1 Tax=Pieris napi TaxID=78633 RepID=UPI001FBA357D|nr:uncharacterized protein LOC125049932 [Pieris napi]
MQKTTRACLPSAAATACLSLLLIICLTEGASEQRINSRGSKSSNLFQKVNGWRSQRGGSCLSYGHSCWGAHGKRSGKPPATAPATPPDWYITKMLRQIAANNVMNHDQSSENKKEDSSDIYRVVFENNAPNAHRLERDSEEVPLDFASKLPEAKPMLDDDLLSKLKLWQLMRVASEEN